MPTTFPSFRIARLPFLLGAGLLATWSAQAPARADTPASSTTRELIERYSADFDALKRLHPIALSENRAERLRKFYRATSAQLHAVPFEKLGADGRVDFHLLKNELRHALGEMDHEKEQRAEMMPLLPFAPAIIELEEARRRMDKLEAAHAAQQLSRITQQLSDSRTALQKRLKEPAASKENAAGAREPSLPTPVVANRAARAVEGLRRTLEDWHDFYAGYDPEFTWWSKQPYQKADQALQDYTKFLRQELAGHAEGEEEPIIGDPIGREALLRELAYEMISYTPEELIEIANQEFAWCEAEYRRAARELGFGGDWQKALDHVKNRHVKPGDQPRLIKELAEEAVAFLEERDLVTIPPLCKEIWRMEMMPAERQKVSPYFTGGEVISVSFPTDEMSHEDKIMSLRGNNIHFCRATVHHELIPGHHLQGFMAARYQTHRRIFRTPFLVEGWALYWEMLLWDLGFPKTAEDRIGMLFWRSHRCARIIFSLNFHLGKMTPQECIDFLVDRVGHERRNATAEVRRSVSGGYGPLYQAAYLLGGLQIRALRQELVEAGAMTDREFHDAILHQNSIPIELIRARLKGEKLAPDYAPGWKFYPSDRTTQQREAGKNEGADETARRKVESEPARPRVYREKIDPHWFEDGAKFWYRNDLAGGKREFILVDTEAGSRAPAFDHGRVAAALAKATGQAVSGDQLPVGTLEFVPASNSVWLRGEEAAWKLDLENYELEKENAQSEKEDSLPVQSGERPSLRTGEESEILFVNKLQEELRLYWIDSEGKRRPFGTLAAGERRKQHTFGGHVWLVVKLNGVSLGVFEASDRPRAAILDGRSPDAPARGRGAASQDSRREAVSPDGRWEAFVRGHNLHLRDLKSGDEFALSHDANPDSTYARDVQRERAMSLRYDAEPPAAPEPEVYWAPNSRWLAAMRTRPGTERTVFLVESSPKDQLQPKLLSYPYLKPGDEIPVKKPRLFDVEAKREIELDDVLFENPWSITEQRWSPDSSQFTFLYNQRGHQVLRVVGVRFSAPLERPLAAGSEEAIAPRFSPGAAIQVRALIDEKSETFIDYAYKKFTEHLDETDEIIWMSERDGWNHLYLCDARAARVKNPITRGRWVVRGVEKVDAKARQIWFRASGVFPGQDPYFMHYGRVHFDGSGLVWLTEADGNHSVQFSPNRRFFIDTWSRVDMPPEHALRRGDTGELVCHLESADASELILSGWKAPESFAAKGRDGTTDIHGIIHRPKNFDPSKKYPVIEHIYAGPHSAYVPKSFRNSYRQEQLTERGFAVVQIDGMGTSHRSKAFHDVAWKNLGDAGFLDRILWMQAAAARYPWLDLSRVGIYGGSAGGQNAMRALIAHGDFYKAAAADCGCHDNRMDKIWWNELWMGWPPAPHYDEASNVKQAHRLQGKLLLTVGELDKNVDPASTLQVVDALIKADKDFEMLVIPGAGHGAGESAYAQRRRADFFARHLLNEGKESR